MILPPSRPSNALPNGTTLFSTTVPHTGADETVLDTQSIPDPFVSVRHHHSFAQIIIRRNCSCGIKSLLRPTPKYLVHGAARGSDQTSSKKNPNDDCDVREKVDIPKRQDDEMAIFLSRPALHSWKAVFPLWRSTTQHLGRVCEWHLGSSQVWKWCIVCTSQSCSRIFFFSKLLTLRANVKRMTNQQKMESCLWANTFLRAWASSEREQVSRE